jgi:7,8-dihydro-6-hydroxymethylpterin-pyrophosphokinase
MGADWAESGADLDIIVAMSDIFARRETALPKPRARLQEAF